MTIYNIYIFARNGTCLFYQEWQRKKESNMPKDEEFKLTYGMLFSLKSFVSRISPVNPKDRFLSYKTNRYKLHLYESATGLKILMNTDVSVANVNDYLHHIYKLYVDLVIKSPTGEIDRTTKITLAILINATFKIWFARFFSLILLFYNQYLNHKDHYLMWKNVTHRPPSP